MYKTKSTSPWSLNTEYQKLQPALGFQESCNGYIHELEIMVYSFANKT